MAILWPFFGHFFGNYISIFHKTEIQTVILRCLKSQNLNWIKNYDIIFFHAWKCIILVLVCQSEFWQLLRKWAIIFPKWLFFQNSCELPWNTQSGKIRKNCFLTFSLKKFWINFCHFHFETESILPKSGWTIAPPPTPLHLRPCMIMFFEWLSNVYSNCIREN